MNETTEQAQDRQSYEQQAFDYARTKVKDGDWSWEYAFAWTERAVNAYDKGAEVVYRRCFEGE